MADASNQREPLRIEDIPEEARDLAVAEAEKVTGGLVSRGGQASLGGKTMGDVTWTAPTTSGTGTSTDLYRMDD